jgi:guanosine-3',5'-bis(diphosphate) 3'-pyrophosphohydrolase
MPNLLLKTIAFAAEKHKNQRRKDVEASPYINHPIALAHLLAESGGIANSDVLCAALLHDTVEDTQTSQAELIEHFGVKIASIVMEVTDDKTLSKDERKQKQIDSAPHISIEAKLVKLADKICNLRDIIAAPPKGWSLERRQEYVQWCQKVVRGMKGTNHNLEKIFDELVIEGEQIQ